MSPIDAFWWVQLTFSLVCIGAGLANRTTGGQIVVPLGVMLALNATTYFVIGSAYEAVWLPILVAGFLGAAAWLVRSVRGLQSSTRRGRPS